MAGRKLARIAADTLFVLGALWIALIAGNELAALAMKSLVLGFWRGFQDWGNSYLPYNIIGFIGHLLQLSPAFILIGLGAWLESVATKGGGLTVRSGDRIQRVPLIVGLIFFALLGAFVLFISARNPAPDPNVVSAYRCQTIECEDHASGYKWAEVHRANAEEDCALDKSRSFRAGCRYWLKLHPVNAS